MLSPPRPHSTCTSVEGQGWASGSLTFSNGLFREQLHLELGATVDGIDPPCYDVGTCAAVQARIVGASETKGSTTQRFEATCTGDSICHCEIKLTADVTDEQPYVVEGNGIRINGHNLPSYYCIQGDTLAFSPTTTPQPTVFIAKKR
jgi:hypothetical protein